MLTVTRTGNSLQRWKRVSSLLLQAADSSMMGEVFDRFVESSEAMRYMSEKPQLGAGTVITAT